MRYNEIIESLEASDLDLFGEAPPVRDVDRARMMFKLKYNQIRRIPDKSGDVLEYLNRMYQLDYEPNNSFNHHANTYAHWSMNVYSSTVAPIGVMHEVDSSGGDYTYIGARSKQELEQVLQELYDTGNAESPDARKARIAAARQRRLDTVAKKGIKVGSQIRVHYFGTQEVIATVTKISPAGKITLQYLHPNVPERGPIEYTTTANTIKKADVINAL